MAVAVAQPLQHAEAGTRVQYLKRVALLTTLGLGVSVVSGITSALMVAVLPFLQNQVVSLIIILGSYAIAQFVAPRFVFSGTPAKWIGFGVGSVFQGIAMGYLLLAAVIMGAQVFGNPLALVLQAMLLTGLTSFGMVVYLWSNPKELSWLRAGLSMLFLPMLILMGVSFVFPIGGPFGILLSVVFVGVSAVGLLYQTNQVLHKLRSDMYVEGAYMITMGILILFWNILVLLMRLTRR
ncbi:MAG: Bax inhibitor-1/YccA family protein [Deltaproteobacteria bacterium]|nr:Bax inhibitor-1/YccA family protein [Deltaproteobacteria bacterium]